MKHTGSHSMRAAGSTPTIAALAALAAAGVWTAATPAMAQQASLQVVIDASASMEDQVGSELKYKLVRIAAQKILPRYDSRLEMGLVAFGYGDRESCQDAAALAPRKAANSKAVLLALDAAKPKGMSPIGAALSLAGSSGGAPTEILMIVDGGDNCGGNVCAIAEQLAAAAPRTRVHVIGLGATSSLKGLTCVAEKTRGSFSLVASLAELEAGIDRVLLTAMTPAVAAPVAAEAEPERAVTTPETPPRIVEAPPLPQRKPHRAPPIEASAPTNAPAGSEVVASKNAEKLSSAPPMPEQRPDREELVVSVEPEAAAPEPATPAIEPAPKELASLPPSVAEMPVPPLALPDEPEQGMGGMLGAEGMAGMSGGFIGMNPDINSGLATTETPVRLAALITDGGDEIRSGLIWRIYKAKRGETGEFELVTSSEAPRLEAKLPIGSYLVHLSWGRSHLTERMDVLSSKPMARSLVLNAGGMRLHGRSSDGSALPAEQMLWRIYSEERDQSGNRQLLIDQAPGGKIIRLNAGIYHVESVLGTANGIVEADLTVEAGKLTDAVITHTATQVTFKLVHQPGGEALAGALWRIKSPEGATIKETGGALPTQILAAGEYQIEAQYSGRTFARKVTIEPGDPVHVEIVIQ